MFFFITLNQYFGQWCTVQFHQVVKQSVVHLLLLGDATVMSQTLTHQPATDVLISQEHFQYLFYIIDIRPALKNAAEQTILRVYSRFVENIAIEGLGGIERSHALYLNAGPSEQHRP